MIKLSIIDYLAFLNRMIRIVLIACKDNNQYHYLDN